MSSRSRRRGHRRHRTAYLYIAPALLYVGVFVLYPIGRAVWMSFTDTSLLNPSDGRPVGLDNYKRLLTSDTLVHVLMVTLVYVVAVSAGALVIGALCSFLLESLSRGKSTARTLLAIPWTLPTLVVGLLFGLIFNLRTGILNAALNALGIQPVGWLNSDGIALVSVIAVTTWTLFPFAMLVILAAMQGVPKELYEAAAIDGAGPVAMAWRITIPTIAPTLRVVLLFLFIWSFSQFQIIWILTQGGPIRGTDILVIDLYRSAFLNDQLGMAAAIGVVGMIPAIAVTVGYFIVESPMRNRARESRPI